MEQHEDSKRSVYENLSYLGGHSVIAAAVLTMHTQPPRECWLCQVKETKLQY